MLSYIWKSQKSTFKNLDSKKSWNTKKKKKRRRDFHLYNITI